jgi:hypothetical protein
MIFMDSASETLVVKIGLSDNDTWVNVTDIRDFTQQHILFAKV